MPGLDAAGLEPSIVLHEEQASITCEWIPVSRVRISRRIVTEVQTIEVELRREELVVTEEPLDPDHAAPLEPGTAPVTPEPLVFVLSAETPSVSLTVLPVERVTVTPTLVSGERDVDLRLRAEGLRLDTDHVTPTTPTHP